MEKELNYFEKYSITELLFLKDGADFDFFEWAKITLFDLLFKNVLSIENLNSVLYLVRGEKFVDYSFNYIENQIVHMLKCSDTIKVKVEDLILIIDENKMDNYDLKKTLSSSIHFSKVHRNFFQRIMCKFSFNNTFEHRSMVYINKRKEFELKLKEEFSINITSIENWFKKLKGKSFLMSNCFIDFFMCFSENEKFVYEAFYVMQINNYNRSKIIKEAMNSNSSSGCGSGCSGCGS